MQRENIPKEILISFNIDAVEKETLEGYFSEKAGRKVTLRKPERGSMRQLCDIAVANAAEKARQSKIEAQKDEEVLVNLSSLLGLETVPIRIEAYDISNIGSENVTAGMVVYYNAKPLKSDYRIFNIKTIDGVDDYGSMREALRRRLFHLTTDTKGAFSEYPDLILIDGGTNHVSVAEDVLKEFGIQIPVFGMVKDDYHKTRALCTSDKEINIAKDRSIFTLIYKIQEEVHRFTVGKTDRAKRSTLKHSSLEKIQGIGPVKAKKLLAHFGTLSDLKNASFDDIIKISGISRTDADNICKYFKK